MAAGQNAAARGSAGWPGDVIIREPHTFFGQPIEMRRLNGLESNAAEVGPALIVADNEQDVGPVGGKSRADLDRAEDHQQQKQNSNSRHRDLRSSVAVFRYYACDSGSNASRLATD